VQYYARWVAEAPDDLTSSVVFMNFRPTPDVPEAMRGQSFLMVRGCWSGDLAEGQRFVDSFRAALPPVMDSPQRSPQRPDAPQLPRWQRPSQVHPDLDRPRPA